MWILVLAMGWAAYSPALTGGFLFDDFVNLPSLGEMGPIDDRAAFFRYVTSGTADPTGRPLALISFLVDAQDWPADPRPFLQTNLILHLVNASLLLLLLRHLGHVLNPGDNRESWAALVAAAMWFLHPLFVSTTMYIVQREAMLPALFIMGGLLTYAHGRMRFVQSGGASGLLTMLAGILFGTLLAFLSKANGILLPLLVWSLEATVYRAARPTIPKVRTHKLLMLGGVYLPSALVLGYVCSYLLKWNDLSRGWTIGQRVLTESRVLTDYLNLLVVPRSVSTGLYNDNYTVSLGLLHPAGTLPAILVLALLLTIAVKMRDRVPAFSAAVLFYFAGHALESTTIPLELYFEHRNYLPALLFFWPLARAICRLDKGIALRACTAAFVLALLTLTTWQRASYWGKPDRLSALWAISNPESSRAQATAAIDEILAGRPDAAANRLRPLLVQQPRDLQLALNYVNAACASGGLSPNDLDLLAQTLRTADIGTLLVRQWIERAIAVASSGNCPGLSLTAVEYLLQAAQENPKIATPIAREKSIPPLLAMLSIAKGDGDKALVHLNRALLANISPTTAAGQAALLASHGHYQQALSHLDNYDRIKHLAPRPQFGMPYVHQLVLDSQQYWPKELALLRYRIQLESLKQVH